MANDQSGQDIVQQLAEMIGETYRLSELSSEETTLAYKRMSDYVNQQREKLEKETSEWNNAKQTRDEKYKAFEQENNKIVLEIEQKREQIKVLEAKMAQRQNPDRERNIDEFLCTMHHEVESQRMALFILLAEKHKSYIEAGKNFVRTYFEQDHALQRTDSLHYYKTALEISSLPVNELGQPTNAVMVNFVPQWIVEWPREEFEKNFKEACMEFMPKQYKEIVEYEWLSYHYPTIKTFQVWNKTEQNTSAEPDHDDPFKPTKFWIYFKSPAGATIIKHFCNFQQFKMNGKKFAPRFDSKSSGPTNRYYSQQRYGGTSSGQCSSSASGGPTNRYYSQQRYGGTSSGQCSSSASGGPTNRYYSQQRYGGTSSGQHSSHHYQNNPRSVSAGNEQIGEQDDDSDW